MSSDNSYPRGTRKVCKEDGKISLMRRQILILCLILMCVCVASCKNQNSRETETNMIVTVGEYRFEVILEDNATTTELIEILEDGPIVVNMKDYSGFEKVGPLDRSLTRNDKQTTTHSGDIVLYNGNNIVIFYGSNSWSYTRIGRVADLSDWKKALGSGDVKVQFSVGD